MSCIVDRKGYLLLYICRSDSCNKEKTCICNIIVICLNCSYLRFCVCAISVICMYVSVFLFIISPSTFSLHLMVLSIQSIKRSRNECCCCGWPFILQYLSLRLKYEPLLLLYYSFPFVYEGCPDIIGYALWHLSLRLSCLLCIYNRLMSWCRVWYTDLSPPPTSTEVAGHAPLQSISTMSLGTSTNW